MKRYPQMDVLRAAAALAVVMIHVSAGSTGTLARVCNLFSRFAVPMFLMLSGFGHGAGFGEGGWRKALRRRLGRILPPYLIWSAVYLLLDAAFGKPHARPIYDLLFGMAYMHLYYLFVLLQFLLLCPLLYRAVERRPWLSLGLSAVISLPLQAALCLQYLGRPILPSLPLPLMWTFLPWLLFYVGGLFLRRRFPDGPRVPIPCAAALWLAAAALMVWVTRRFPALWGLSLRPDVTLYTLAVWLLLWSLCGRLQSSPKPLRAFCRLSFALYLSHPLVMRLWYEWTTRRTPVIYLRLWQSFLLTLTGGLLIAALLSLLPFGALLGGAPKRRKKIPPRT